MATNIDLEATRGDTWYWEFTVLQRDRETPQDITGASFRFTAKYDPNDSDAEAPIVGTNSTGECQVTDGLSGILTVKIPPAQTALVEAPTRLAYDLQGTDGGGNVYTIATGRIDVDKDISVTQP